MTTHFYIESGKLKCVVEAETHVKAILCALVEMAPVTLDDIIKWGVSGWSGEFFTVNTAEFLQEQGIKPS